MPFAHRFICQTKTELEAALLDALYLAIEDRDCPALDFIE